MENERLLREVIKPLLGVVENLNTILTFHEERISRLEHQLEKTKRRKTKKRKDNHK